MKYLNTLIGASVSEPLSSDVYVDFVCLSWTVVRHSNGACVSFFAHGPYGMATAHASHFFARGSVCYYGYCLSSVLISEVLEVLT